MWILCRNRKQLYFTLNLGVLLFCVQHFSLHLNPFLLTCWIFEASPLGKTEPVSILTVKKNDSAIPTARLSMVSKANTVAFCTGCLPVSPVVRIISTETSITWFHACKLWQQRCIRKGGIIYKGVTARGCMSKKAGSRICVFGRRMISQSSEVPPQTVFVWAVRMLLKISEKDGTEEGS